MLSSNSSCNYNPNFPENDITTSSHPKVLDQLAASPTNFFPNSPHMHLEYQDVYLQFLELFYQHQYSSSSITTHDHETINATRMAPDSNEDAAAKGANPKATKKDRHSKINTARGPRDRRMRLSLDIARRFFHLQDLLGYEKASTTVEWLLTNSGPAIAKLARGRGLNSNNSNNPISTEQSSTCEQECEVVSSMVPANRRRREKVKKAIGRATVARESRRKARERARERTSQKRRLIIDHAQPKLYEMQQQVNQVEHLITSPPWNPSLLFDDNAAVFFNQNEQIVEFQFGGKPWEAFNTFHLSG